MPWADNSGVRIYWEEEGSGEPLLMIMGLSFSLAMWGELRPFLARHFRTLLFDNRCVGLSDAPRPPFPLAAMARDAVAVLDAAGVRKASVVGFSMGGMIAQELALLCPERLDRLVLACTHCGGLKSVRADWRVLHVLASPFIAPELKLNRLVPFIYHPQTPRERIERDLKVIRSHQPTFRGLMQQLTAIVSWHAWSRLPRIKAETLVIHGEDDLLVPPGNARILADRIPGARLTLLPRASHVFPTDQPELTRSALFDFLVACPNTAIKESSP
jgi:pimeloyl-ACP methyl ester carboxylesterase